jgi:hypothetical protein
VCSTEDVTHHVRLVLYSVLLLLTFVEPQGSHTRRQSVKQVVVSEGAGGTPTALGVGGFCRLGSVRQSPNIQQAADSLRSLATDSG